jgi:membrane-bound serine protease (ClpP class)
MRKEDNMTKKQMLKTMRFAIYFVLMIPFISTVFLTPSVSADKEKPLVYVVPIEETIESGLHAFLERAFREAEDSVADHIILDINTPGGAVKAASDIGDLLQKTKIPITAFVNPDATSAGAYIALNANNILMVPTGTMGSATVVNLEGNAGDAKVMAYWISKMEGAAEVNGRDPLYAKAMVDPEVEIEGLTPKGTPLDFKASQALEHGYAEGIVESLDEALTFLELGNATIIVVEPTIAEKVSRFITHPVVVSILFSLASLGIILELYSPGIGIPGMVGVSSLLLFFFGHMIAGFAGWESLLLFVVGIILIAIEIFMPGFGVFGILGAVSVIGSLALASIDIISGLKSIGIAALVTVVVLLILGRSLTKRGFWSKLVLQEAVSTDEGKAYSQKKTELLGKTGVTLTQLRPAGTVKIGDRRYDVVSRGEFIENNKTVKVIDVEGTRIVVSEVGDSEE